MGLINLRSFSLRFESLYK